MRLLRPREIRWADLIARPRGCVCVYNSSESPCRVGVFTAIADSSIAKQASARSMRLPFHMVNLRRAVAENASKRRSASAGAPELSSDGFQDRRWYVAVVPGTVPATLSTRGVAVSGAGAMRRSGPGARCPVRASISPKSIRLFKARWPLTAARSESRYQPRAGASSNSRAGD